MENILRDAHNRIIRDLRVSLTDRCNFRCFYCLPNGEPPLARKDTILTFEEIARVSEIFVSLGIEKIRLTGGEPLIRRDVEKLVEKLAELKEGSGQQSADSDQKDELRITNYELRGKSAVQSPQSKVASENNRRRTTNDEQRTTNNEQRTNGENPKSKIQNPKLKDLALTTNGYTFPRRAEALKRAGLDRVTISLDSLKRENFKRITGIDALPNVLQSIEAAKNAGLTPVKINAVVVRGWNDDEIADFARFARETDVSMRFIEFMPLDSGHEWRREMIVSGKEIRDKIEEVFPLKLREKSRGAETAWKYSFSDGAAGEIGIIAPVTEMFCGACSRIRLTADGQIRTCLFSSAEHNLRDVLRSGASRAEIIEFIRAVVMKKEARHRINDAGFVQPARTMSFIGG